MTLFQKLPTISIPMRHGTPVTPPHRFQPKSIRWESTREESAEVFPRYKQRGVPYRGGGTRVFLVLSDLESWLGRENEKEKVRRSYMGWTKNKWIKNCMVMLLQFSQYLRPTLDVRSSKTSNSQSISPNMMLEQKQWHHQGTREQHRRQTYHCLARATSTVIPLEWQYVP